MSTAQRVRSRARGVFPGWWIVLSCLGLLTLQAGLFQQTYGLYVAVLQEDFGWSKTALSLAFAFQSVEGALLGPVQGWMIDRFGAKAVLRLGLIIFAFGFMLLSLINSLTMFYIAFVVAGIGASLCGFLSLMTSIVHWFERKRTTAMGITQLGMSFGGLALPLVAWTLDSYGWRMTVLGAAIISLVVGLPLTSLVKSRPEDHGYLPDGLRPEDAGAPVDNDAYRRIERARPSVDFTPREAVRTRAFWFMSLGHAAALLVVSAVQVHMVLHLTNDVGYSLEAAASVVAIMTLIQVPGRLLGGVLGDRFDKRILTTGAMFGHAIGLLFLAYADSAFEVMLFVVLHGMAWGIRSPLMESMRADYFGRTSFGTIMGWSSMITKIGPITGPVIAGILADRFGNYEIGFTILALLAGGGSIFFALARKPNPPVREARPSYSY